MHVYLHVCECKYVHIYVHDFLCSYFFLCVCVRKHKVTQNVDVNAPFPPSFSTFRAF